MTTPVTGLRIPPDLSARIDALVADGKSKTDVILRLIQVGLGEELPTLESAGMTEMRASLDALSNRLTAVEQHSLTKPRVPKATHQKPREDDLEGGSEKAAGSLSFGMSERELARRLDVDRTGFNSKRNNLEKLAIYTAARDPEGVAWEFRDGRYFPVAG